MAAEPASIRLLQLETCMCSRLTVAGCEHLALRGQSCDRKKGAWVRMVTERPRNPPAPQRGWRPSPRPRSPPTHGHNCPPLGCAVGSMAPRAPNQRRCVSRWVCRSGRSALLTQTVPPLAGRQMLRPAGEGKVYSPVRWRVLTLSTMLATIAFFNESRIACLSSAPCCFGIFPSRTIPETHAGTDVGAVCVDA